ncbi:MAG: hypothetical protein J6M62_10415 [Selenomonadaceae bacterium]|nr:hypothetical protein [Selenomonadaceae bacterium]
MTVETQSNKTAKQVMGAYTYSFTFRTLLEDPTSDEAKQAIKVKISDGTTEYTLTYGTDYTVALDASGYGGTITVTDAKNSSWGLVIYREYGMKQGSNYRDYDEFPAATLEGGLDKQMMVAQQLQEQLDRCVKTGITSDIDPDVLVLQVERVYNSIGNVDTVANNISSVNTTSSNIGNVNTVAGDIANINAVAGDLTNIDAVKNNATNINAVAGNATNINTIAEDKANIDAVAADLANVDAVSSNLTNINAVKNNATNINAVAGNESNINAVASNATNINAVNANKTNIDTVAGDTASINAIAADLENIDAASTYANLAKDWANKTNGTVDDSEYSAKHYAEAAAASAASVDDTNIVHKTGTETISGDKNFSGALKQGGYNVVTTNDFDTKPTSGSTKPVTSGGLYNEFQTEELIEKNIYTGVNLQTKFASEISSYSSVWAWIKARIQAGNYAGIHIGDYIPVTITAGTVGSNSVAAQTFNCQVAGIDTYYRCADTDLGHHIDFISKEVCDTAVTWNDSNCNNGTSAQNSPWLASKVYGWLNGVNNAGTAYGNNSVGINADGKGLYHRLPSALRNVITNKRQLLDNRYSGSSLINGSTGWGWADMGNLWLPNEIEVYGTQIRSNLCQTVGYWNPEAQCSAQYPVFKHSVYTRIKYTSNGGRASWWLSSADGNGTTDACFVHGNGRAGGNGTTTTGVFVPLCFRIT